MFTRPIKYRTVLSYVLREVLVECSRIVVSELEELSSINRAIRCYSAPDAPIIMYLESIIKCPNAATSGSRVTSRRVNQESLIIPDDVSTIHLATNAELNKRELNN